MRLIDPEKLHMVFNAEIEPQHVESVGEKKDCVEVVRCKDCKRNDHGCTRWDAPINDDDFCSYGKPRRGNDREDNQI